MKKALIVLLLSLLPVISFAQSLSLFSKASERTTGEMKTKFSAEVKDAQFLNVNKNSVQQILSSNSKTLELNLPLENGANASLKLSEYNILTDNAIISMMTNEGEKIYNGKIPFKCYKGVFNNDVNSLAVICISDYFVKGILLTEGSSYTLSTFGDNELSNNCILYEDSKLKIKNDFHCGSEAFAIPDKIKNQMQSLKPESVSNTFLQANIAIEIDKITYATYGSSVPNASAASLALLSVVSAIYNRDINVKLVVPYIHVWITTDPYTGASSGDLLDQFVDHWNANFSSVNRTLAHFLTRRSGGLGGIAYLDVLCDSPVNGLGYGFSNIMGAYSQLPVYSWDVMVVAHELGHNFGSPHTFSCSWQGGPIDTCYAPEGSCYNGPTRSRVGTIMSYCHLNGSIDLRLGFGPLPKALIRTNAENAPCISPAPEQLLLSYPQGGETFATSTQQYLYWGTSSASNFNIDLTTNNGTSWTSLAIGVPAQQHYYVWTVPYIPTSTNCKIKIYDAGNPSIADTVNGTFTIKATLNSLSLTAPVNGASYFTTYNDTSRVVFSWTSSGTLPAIKYKWKIRKPGGQYISFTSDSNGAATRFTIRKSKLDSLAAYNFGLTGDSVICGWIASSFINSDSLSSEIRFVTIRTNTVSVKNISTVIPIEHKLYTNYPNPFNPVTKIKFEIPKDEFVKITVFDLSGKAVSEIVNEKLKAGIYEADFNGINLASGTYFYKIETASFIQTKKMILIK
jgi:hypothetical protein